MTGAGNPAVYDIEELSEADQLSVVGVGGTSRLKQRGKMQCCVPAEVVHGNPELEQIMRQVAQDVVCRESHGVLCYRSCCTPRNFRRHCTSIRHLESGDSVA
jgi:hypothetical protein